MAKYYIIAIELERSYLISKIDWKRMPAYTSAIKSALYAHTYSRAQEMCQEVVVYPNQDYAIPKEVTFRIQRI